MCVKKERHTSTTKYTIAFIVRVSVAITYTVLLMLEDKRSGSNDDDDMVVAMMVMMIVCAITDNSSLSTNVVGVLRTIRGWKRRARQWGGPMGETG